MRLPRPKRDPDLNASSYRLSPYHSGRIMARYDNLGLVQHLCCCCISGSGAQVSAMSGSWFGFDPNCSSDFMFFFHFLLVLE